MANRSVVQAFLAVISVVAFFGNALVVALLLKKREWLKKVHYCLLLSLAVQDILTAVGLMTLPGFVNSSDVYELPGNSILNTLYCSVIWSRYIPFALAISSVYTCLMLALDRCYAVFKPAKYRQFSNSGTVRGVMVVLPWLAGIGFEIYRPLNVRYIEEENGTGVCGWLEIESTIKKKIVAVLLLIGMIMLPAILMITAYGKIVLRRRMQASRVLPRIVIRSNSILQPNVSMKRLTRMACTASAVVVICWLPDQLYFCLFHFGLVELRTGFHDALIILAFLNTCINPLLYTFSNKQHAEEFESILCCGYHRERSESLSQRPAL